MTDILTIILTALSTGTIATLGVKVIDAVVARRTTDAEIAAKLRDELWQRFEAVKKEVDSLNVDKDKLEARCDGLNADRDKLEARCDSLEAEIAAERKRSQDERDARLEAERLASELAERNDKLANECATMKRRITMLEQEVRDLRGAAQKRIDDPLQR
jgi:chaperonin cofactor prefoldin